jgi:phosphoglycerol transferase MdoB-like AlkP superfamily enzyme
MKHFLSLVRQYLFWMVFFFLLRAMFLLSNIYFLRAEDIHWTEAMAAFWHALYLDTATACYLLIVPMLLLTVQCLFDLPVLNKINKVYTLIFIILSTLVATAELALYPEWKTKLTAKALIHLKHPAEVYESVSALQFFGLLFLVAILSGLGFYVYKKVFFLPVLKRLPNRFLTLVFFLVSGSLLVIGLRGGVKPIPIMLGVSYYSHHSVLNWAAVNSNYNLMVNYIESERYNEKNPFDFYPHEDARAVVDSLLSVSKDTTNTILRSQRPNIVILLMESWSADLIESLGGEPGITPEFRELEEEGVLFTRLYSSGNRSQQGLASIIAGFPAIPYTTITENPDKYQKLPSFTEIFKAEGYYSSFYFGGDLDYGNIRAYLLQSGVEEIIEEKDIPDSVPRGRLGIHDGYMMDIHAAHLNKLEEPFFSVLFTLSSHSPYDQPKEHTIEWQGPEAQYVNSAYYSDHSLGEYFRKVKQEQWYDSTLFIILADHSHNSYRNWPLESFNYRKVPMLLLGGALKDEYRGTKITRLSSNTDLPATLLSQMGLETKDLYWSRDLFNPYSREFAYFEINDGLGWKTPIGEFVYNVRWDNYLTLQMQEGTLPQDKERLLREGKAFFQVLFQDFIDL